MKVVCLPWNRTRENTTGFKRVLCYCVATSMQVCRKPSQLQARDIRFNILNLAGAGSNDWTPLGIRSIRPTKDKSVGFSGTVRATAVPCLPCDRHGTARSAFHLVFNLVETANKFDPTYSSSFWDRKSWKFNDNLKPDLHLFWHPVL